MKIALATLVLFFLSNFPAHAGCSKKEICGMLGKMTHFGILDKCPGAGSLLAECKKVNETIIEDLPPAAFVDNGDGTVTDTVNKLVWIKKGTQDKQGKLNKVKLKIEKRIKEFISSGIEWKPINKISLDKEKTKIVLNFLETLDEDDDVQHVYANLEIGDNFTEEISA